MCVCDVPLGLSSPTLVAGYGCGLRGTSDDGVLQAVCFWWLYVRGCGLCQFGNSPSCPLVSRPKFSVVVVTKRIITRIFLNQRGQISNPPPGTVVDTEITKPQW